MRAALQAAARLAAPTAAAARPAAAAAYSTGAPGTPLSAAQWLERFTNYERAGVPTAAGTDTADGFDLARGGGSGLLPAGRRRVALLPCTRRLEPPPHPPPPFTCPPHKQGRMRRLLADLGDPQAAWPAVHVAGTKGKGSTTAMVAAMLTAAGYHAGAYTRRAAVAGGSGRRPLRCVWLLPQLAYRGSNSSAGSRTPARPRPPAHHHPSLLAARTCGR